MNRAISFLLVERCLRSSLGTAGHAHVRLGRLHRELVDRLLPIQYYSTTIPHLVAPSCLPRSRKSRNRRVALINQQATLFSLPGGSEKRKDYAERRILGFSMEQMFDIVADVEKYQDFLPWCQSSVVKSRRKNHILADLVVGFPPLLESYTSSVTLTHPNLIKAESTQGKLFNQMITIWKFSPGLKGRPQTCVVDFYVSFEFRSSLTSQLGNMFFNEVVKAMAGAFFEEAKKRYGAESIPSRKINIIPVHNNKK